MGPKIDVWGMRSEKKRAEYTEGRQSNAMKRGAKEKPPCGRSPVVRGPQ